MSYVTASKTELFQLLERLGEAVAIGQDRLILTVRKEGEKSDIEGN